MKISGLELIDFINNGFPEDEDDIYAFYWDHEEFDESPDPNKIYDTDDLGHIFYQGAHTDPTNGEGYDTSKLIKAWRERKTHEIFEIKVPKPFIEEFLAYAKQHNIITSRTSAVEG